MRMRSRSEPAEQMLVLVETAMGSSDYRVDPRLRVDEVRQRSDDALSRAVLSVQLDGEFDAEEARRAYDPDRRIVVTTVHPDAAQREVLFEGFPRVQRSRWDGRTGREADEYRLELEHVYERLSRAPESWVYGRHMRSGEIEDGLLTDPETYASRSVLLQALPCVFNPDGVGNRAVQPMQVRLADGVLRPVHLFTWDGGDAEPWTYATALRYLAWFYLGRSSLVHAGNVFEATDALANGSDGHTDGLQEALGRACQSLACEATNLVEALALLACAAGIHATAETVNDLGRPRTQLRVWSSRNGPIRQLHLARCGRHQDGALRFDASAMSPGAVLRHNNTYRAGVTWDHRPIVNRVLVLGGIKKYEVTVPLWPGWRCDPNLDNVSLDQRVARKVAALTPDDVKVLGDGAENVEWYRRYHRDGSLYALYCDVGRSWVLNEDGAYDAATYNRNAPFHAYTPFDFTAVMPAGELRQGGWVRRPRAFMPTLSVGADGRSLGVWVEVSFDGGARWYAPNCSVSVRSDRAGIHLECDNPTQVIPPGGNPLAQNLWYAIIDQSFRVRVTAVIEGDERLVGEYGPAGLGSPTSRVHATILSRPKAYLYARRSDVSNVLYSSMAAGTEARDDTQAIAGMAYWLAKATQDRQVQVTPAIPWIETGYAIGDRVSEVAGRELRFATRVGSELQYPAVLERRFVLVDGRYDTELTLAVPTVRSLGV